MLTGDAALRWYLNIPRSKSPFVQDETGQIWEDFLGSSNAQRKQVVLLDKDLNHRFQFEYDGAELITSELDELLNSIQILINEIDFILGDLNNDQTINVLDLIIMVDIALDEF